MKINVMHVHKEGKIGKLYVANGCQYTVSPEK